MEVIPGMLRHAHILTEMHQLAYSPERLSKPLFANCFIG